MKHRYHINKDNQLSIQSPKAKKRVTVNGRFSTNENNALIYWLNEPLSWRRQYGLPDKIRLKGSWQLTANYDLKLNLDEAKDQDKASKLILKGEIISLDADILIFELESIDKGGMSHFSLIKLTGFLRSDMHNQISFLVKKNTVPDILTFKGAWQINENQQLVYTYEKLGLKTKARISHALIFSGFWQINSRGRLTYTLGRSSASYFDFRVQIESPNLYPQEGTIKYRIGIGLRQNKTAEVRIISLYGEWKFNRKLGLIFQMDYGKGMIHGIEFGADMRAGQKDKIEFSLKNKNGQPLGINVTFTHRFLNRLDAEAFLRIEKTLKGESAVEAGARIPF